MDAFIESLPGSDWGATLLILDCTVDNEGNVCTNSQVAAIKAKGRIPRYLDGTTWFWLDYEGSDDDPTGIKPNVETEDANAPIYDLSGKRVNNLEGKKGVYIIGGKKVLKK